MRRGWGGGGVAILLFAALLPFRTLSFSSPAPLGGPTQLHAVERCAYEALRGPCGVSAGDRLLVLASGGSDSTALILIMARLAPCFDPPLDLRVASFDHRLRHDSNHDSSFVSTTARSLGLPCVVRSWECPEQAIAAQGVAVQDLARKWRMAQVRLYEQFRRKL
jgi:tRNA(Ile)-lysidine synthase TilS/MesJ